jgi:hypothetical protein
MFIRRSPTRNKATGESYFTFRLVRTERVGGKVRQVTLLNLGRHFPLAQDEWPTLCARIEQLTCGQASLLPVELSAAAERMAQRYAGQLVARAAPEPAAAAETAPAPETAPQTVAVAPESLELLRPRTVGVEHAGLWALSTLGLLDLFRELGLTGAQQAMWIGTLIGRMAQPASELATWHWLREASGLGELLDLDFEAFPLMALYRASDVLVKHRERIESHVFDRVKDLFALEETVTLYDLTNTYFEGEASAQPKAQRGRSKEKRSDCPLVTLALVVDGSGFVRRSRVFAGNAAEAATLAEMLEGLKAPPGALVVMDAGIATAANLQWLVDQGYRYLVARRGGHRQFDPEQAVAFESTAGDEIRVQKVLSADGREARLYCHSPGREAKDNAIAERFCTRFEAGLDKLAQGLCKPRGEKRQTQILERIGRLKEASRGVGQHYDITVEAEGDRVTALRWERRPVEGTALSHPGVYCLATNETGWDEATLWRTYTTLTDLEAVFRSLKSELGLRPIYHHKESRTDGHLFISVLAYQCVQLIRRRLKEQGIHDSWTRLRRILSVQTRITASFRQVDGHTLNIRKPSRAEPELLAIYRALDLDPRPGGTRKLIR